jgi:hypothetical protein
LNTSYFLFPLMNFSHKNMLSCSFSSPTQPRRKSSPCHRHAAPVRRKTKIRFGNYLMLVGLVAKNAILVVDFTNRLKAEGMELKVALLEATHKRFRPIAMTTLAIIAGMLPIALAKGAGAE